MRASHFARGLPAESGSGGALLRRPNGLGADGISQNVVSSKVTSSFQKFTTLRATCKRRIVVATAVMRNHFVQPSKTLTGKQSEYNNKAGENRDQANQGESDGADLQYQGLPFIRVTDRSSEFVQPLELLADYIARRGLN